jgi:hypothetical protein
MFRPITAMIGDKSPFIYTCVSSEKRTCNTCKDQYFPFKLYVTTKDIQLDQGFSTGVPREIVIEKKINIVFLNLLAKINRSTEKCHSLLKRALTIIGLLYLQLTDHANVPWAVDIIFLCRGSLRPENYFKGSSRVKRLRKAELDQACQTRGTTHDSVRSTDHMVNQQKVRPNSSLYIRLRFFVDVPAALNMCSPSLKLRVHCLLNYHVLKPNVHDPDTTGNGFSQHMLKCLGLSDVVELSPPFCEL